MTVFSVIGISVCVIFGTLFVGGVMACLMTSKEYNDAVFYACMFFGAWLISTSFLIFLLIGKGG